MTVQLTQSQLEALRQARRKLQDAEDLVRRCKECNFPFDELYALYDDLKRDLDKIEANFGRQS